jgi:uncharacterized protein
MHYRTFLKYSTLTLALFAGHHSGAFAQEVLDPAAAQDWLTSLNTAAAVGADDEVAAIVATIVEGRDPDRLFRLARFYSGHPSEHVLPEADYGLAISYLRQTLTLLQGEPGRDARRLMQRTQYELAAVLIRTATNLFQLAEAVELLETAALSGSGEAALRLGVGLADGSLGTIDIDRSIMWLRRALTAGIDEAALVLAQRLYDHGDEAQLEEARGMARLGEAMLRRAALEGSTSAAVALAEAYLQHPLITRDLEQVRSWLDYAVARGDTRGMLLLAQLVTDGTFGDPDVDQARDLLLAAAGEGSVDAALMIGQSLLRQTPPLVQVDPALARTWLDRAMAIGEAGAYRLAAQVAMENGDFAAYRTQLETASTLGDVSAAIELISWRIADGDTAGAESLMATLEGRIALSRVGAVALAEIKLSAGSGSPIYDPDGAVRLLRSAGDQGDGAALYELAMLNWDGIVLQRDLPEAVGLLEESAETGYFRAMIRLVEAYSEGLGVAQSGEVADQWLEKARTAADRRTSNEMLALGRSLLDGLIGPDGTEEGLAWLQRAADLNDPRAMVALGNAYMSGSAGAFDPPRAFGLYQAAVVAGDHQANLYLARAYATGIGTAMDPQAALSAYTIAAEAGSAEAAAELGLIYSSNSDVPADYGQAYDWLRRAADTGHVPAMIHIANLIEVGALDGIAEGTPLAWLTRAAETGDPDAQFQLAVALKRGLLGEVDLAGAEHWMRLAAQSGHFQAQSELQRMLQQQASGS